MKKFIKIFILVICLIFPSLFCLTACDKEDHEHNFATECSSDANYHYHTCTGDGCEETTDKQVHTFGEWITGTNATCTENGEKYRECLECGHRETQTISTIAHNFSTEWSSDASYHYHVCTGDGCEEVADKESHTFGGYIIDETPTTYSAGEYHRECEICHKIEKSTISALKSTGLVFELNKDETSYTLTNIGTCTDTFINVPNTYNGLPVTAIGKEAFKDNITITGIRFSSNLEKIGESAFYGCTGLNGTVVIPDSVINIGKNAFTNCSNLTNITIPNNVTNIEEYAFSNCSNLTSIAIPNNVTSIELGVFVGCSSLTSIVIPNNITNIGTYAFSNCSGLISIIIPNSVTTINLWAFKDCSNLKNVYFTGTTEQWNSINIDNDNSGLTGATKYFYSENIPQELGSNFWHYENGVLELWQSHTEHTYGDWQKDETNHWRVCSYCGFEDKNTHLFSENYSNNETNHWHECVCGTHDADVAHTFKNGVCDDCDFKRIELAFNYLETSNSYEVSGIGRITSNDIVIPSTYDDGIHGTLAVTDIRERAFYNCLQLKSVTISNGVIKIGNYAFDHCYELKNVVIPNSVITIGNSAFNSCRELKNIVIPNSVTTIGNSAFGGCESLETVVIPNSVTMFGDSVFYNCNNLTSAVIGNGITTLSEKTFAECKKLTNITIGSGVTKIGKGAFEYCESLRLVTIPNGVSIIENGAFFQCKGLVNIIIPNSVTTIGQNAFASCTGAISIILGSRVTTLGMGAFYNCTNVTSVIIPNSVRSIGNLAFKNDTKLEKAYYEGAEAQWFLLTNNIGSDNDCLTNHVYYYSETKPQKLNTNFWRYVDGIPKPWPEHTEHTYGDWQKDETNHWRVCSYCGFEDKNEHLCVDGICICGYVEETQGLEYKYVSGNNPYYIVKGIGSATAKHIRIPSTYNGDPVTELHYDAFKNNTNILSVIIPEGVTTIGNSAFMGCTNLTQVSLPSSITSLDSMTFWLSGITSIEIPANITVIGEYTFSECNNLTHIVVPHGVTTIDGNAFSHSNKLETLVIPKSVKNIGMYIVHSCPKLSKIFYTGTQAEWNNINNQGEIDSTKLYFYSETQPITAGNYWRYVDGILTEWINITLKVNAKTGDDALTYGDTISYTASDVVATGLVSGETIESLGTLSFVYSTEENGTYTSTLPKNVGTYYVKVAGCISNKYNITYTAGELEIKKARLTITVLNRTGDNAEYSTDFITVSGLKYDDTIANAGDFEFEYELSSSSAYSPVLPKDAGTYSVISSITNSTNYTSTYVEGTLEIKKATLTMKIKDMESEYATYYSAEESVEGFKYNDNKESAGFSYSGGYGDWFYNKDNPTQKAPKIGSYVDAGEYIFIPQFRTMTNYEVELTYGTRGTYIIKPKEVEVKITVEKSLVCGDELTASDVKYWDNEFNNIEWKNSLYNDPSTGNAMITGTLSYTTNYTKDSSAGEYTIKAQGLVCASGNYKIIYLETTFTVTENNE